MVNSARFDSVPHFLGERPFDIGSLATLKQPGFDALARAWLRQRGDAPAPDADTFDLLEIGQHLENATCINVKDDKRATYRFVGPAICERLQTDPTGKDFAESLKHLPFDAMSAVWMGLSVPAGLHTIYRITYSSGKHTENQSLYLPLISKSGGDNHLWSMQAMGTTIRYKTGNPTSSVIKQTVAANWVDVGSGTPSTPLSR
ncbi:PAS domain-containing protein [Parvibaculaceae bacterium PLY_AMNH_Bact1]|nr:PAS domain-containing protein [Parvibaculaceae bacterium PLY_AMNH_Bact1]